MNLIKRLFNILTISILCLIIASCVHGGGGGGKDSIVITSTDELLGPDGMKTSCFDIAWFYQGEYSITGPHLLRDYSDHPTNSIDLNQKWAGVKFSDWTPNTLSFLNSSIDECVTENSSLKNLARAFDKSRRDLPLNISPSEAKSMFSKLYLLIHGTKIAQMQVIENRNKQTAADNYHAQGIRSGAIQVSNLQDASIKFDALDASQLVMSPKIKPDGKNYRIGGYLEQHTDTTFIATTMPVQAIGSMPFNTRFVVLVPQAFESKYQNTARVGGGIGLIGRYVGNRNLAMVMGNSITVPVFEMIYINTHP